MAYHGPSYGLSRECQMKSQAKFDMQRAKEACYWVEAVTKASLEYPSDEGLTDQLAFGHALKDGIALCTLLNNLQPGLVKKINTMKAPFKQRENLEMFLKGCVGYGLKSQDLFQVNDLYENKNLYMIVDCLYALGGMAQAKSFDGPVIGVKVAHSNKRNFSTEKLKEGQKIIGMQYGYNKGASQAGMTAYGTGRQIIPGEAQKTVTAESHAIIGLQSGSNKGASQAGMTPYGASRQIIPEGVTKKSSKTDLFERRLSESSQASQGDARPQSQCSDEGVSEAGERLNHLQVEPHEDGTPRDSEDEREEEEEEGSSDDAESADGSDH